MLSALPSNVHQKEGRLKEGQKEVNLVADFLHKKRETGVRSVIISFMAIFNNALFCSEGRGGDGWDAGFCKQEEGDEANNTKAFVTASLSAIRESES